MEKSHEKTAFNLRFYITTGKTKIVLDVLKYYHNNMSNFNIISFIIL